MSEYGDIVDRASRVEAEFLEAALQRQRQRQASPQESAFECQCCGEPIPPARRLAVPGVQTCVGCQADLELATNGFAR